MPLDILGEERLPLVLITDRYKGYSPLKVSRQYCYAHLIRGLEKEEKNFPDDDEVTRFANDLKPLPRKYLCFIKKLLTNSLP